jgi:hypothetical protein
MQLSFQDSNASCKIDNPSSPINQLASLSTMDNRKLKQQLMWITAFEIFVFSFVIGFVMLLIYSKLYP